MLKTHSRSKETNLQKKSDQSTQIHRPTNKGKPPKLTTNHHVPSWGPTGQCYGPKEVREVAPWGSAEPGQPPGTPNFGGNPSRALPKVVANVSIPRDAGNLPIQAIKGGGEPSIQDTTKTSKISTWRCSTPLQDEALSRLVLRIGGRERE
jgi:hypothetical protein